MHLRAITFLLVVLALILAACGSSPGLQEPPDAAVDAGGPEASSPDLPPPKVTFADAQLEACVRAALGKDKGDLWPNDMKALTLLECQDRKIEKLDGLEFAARLTDLSLWENAVVDLKPLSTLTELVTLQLGMNQIASLGPLGNLKKLQRLGLEQNRITDLAPLTQLTELRWLNLDSNKIAGDQVSKLVGLDKLLWLTLEHNLVQPADLGQLDQLAKAGCHIYRELRSAPGSQGTSLRAFVPSSKLFARRGELIRSVDRLGEIRFSYLLEGKSLPVIREFPGRIVLEGDSAVWESPEGKVGIGRRSARGIELCQGSFAGVCSFAVGVKANGGRLAGASDAPVVTVLLSLEPHRPGKLDLYAADPAPKTADSDLVGFALASPNQLDAGSCLFMASAGAMEILLNQHSDRSQVRYDGDTDLSERFLMNASEHIPQGGIPYSVTDVAYTYNILGGTLLNKDYRFTAGYVKQTASGGVVKAQSTDKDASFSCLYNWIDELPPGWQSTLTPLPLVERTSIFVEPTRSKDAVWNVGLMNDDIVERIKWEIRSKNAPVLLVYNHYLYWHTVDLIGYDDNEDSASCEDVTSSITYFTQKGATAYVKKIQDHMAKEGGCPPKGTFTVRDSIYDGGAEEPMYSYSDVYDFKEKYSKRIIKHSYGWVKYLANHAYTLHRR